MTGICNANNIYETDSNKKRNLTGNKMHYAYILLKVRSKFILFILALLPLFSERGSISGQILFSLLLQLAALALVLIPALINRHLLRWDHNKDFITLSGGLIYKNEISLPICNIRSVTIAKTLTLSLFKATRLELRSSDGRKKPEITLYLSQDEANALAASVIRPQKAMQTLIPRALPFILTSASRANFAVGILILSVFIASFGGTVKILSNTADYISDTASSLLPYLPPAVSLLSGILLIGWAVHFLNICFTDARQVTTIASDNIFVVRGLITTRLICIRKESIASCTSRETLLTALFGQCTINIDAISQERKNSFCALTAWPSRDHENAFNDLCSFDPKCDISVNVPDNARLIWWLPYGSLLLFFLMLWAKDFVSHGMELSAFSFLMLFGAMLSLWKCVVGIIGSGRGKIEFSGQSITISTVRFFSLYKKKIFMGRIADFTVTSTLLQKHRRLCTVRIKAVGSSKTLKCRNLPFDSVNALFERIK